MFVIPGFTPDDKVPDVVAINQWGAGIQSIGAIPLYCVLFGNPGATAAMTLDQRYPVTSPEEALALADPRSELSRMAYAALEVSSGVNLMIVGVQEAAGAAAATMTIVLGGTWTASGEFDIQLDEEPIRVPIAASDTATTAGDSIATAINQAQNGRLFCTAVNTAGTIVLTVYSKGVRGNQHIAFLTTSLLPSGMTAKLSQLSSVANVGGGPTVTVAGSDILDATYVLKVTTAGANSGTAQYSLQVNGGTFSTPVTLPSGPFALPSHTGITVTAPAGTYILNATYTWSGTAAYPNGGVHFSGGTGTDDIQASLDGTESVQNDYIAAAHNDAVNVAKIETAVNAKAAFDIGLLENYVVAMNGTQVTAIAIGQTTMNDQLGGCIWDQYGVEHPSRTAARAAALYSITEGADPNHNYDDMELVGAPAHFRDSDVPNRATLKSALNNSLTPLVTINGKKLIKRAICSRSLNGSTPDYRTYDRGDVIVPIRIRKELVALGKDAKSKNPYDGPDVEEGLPPVGTFTPRVWDTLVNARLQEWASERFNWLQDVAANPSQSVWDPTAKRIMSLVPTVVKSQFHQLGILVRQTAA